MTKTITDTDLKLITALVNREIGKPEDKEWFSIFFDHIESAMNKDTFIVAAFYENVWATEDEQFLDAYIELKINLDTETAELHFNYDLMHKESFAKEDALRLLNREDEPMPEEFIMNCFLKDDPYTIILTKTDLIWDVSTEAFLTKETKEFYKEKTYY